MRKVLINKEMALRPRGVTFEICMGKIVSPVQKEVFLIIDEWWKRFGFSPSLRDIARLRGKALSGTKKVVDSLVRLGVIKRLDGRVRSIRPVYINFRNLE